MMSVIVGAERVQAELVNEREIDDRFAGKRIAAAGQESGRGDPYQDGCRRGAAKASPSAAISQYESRQARSSTRGQGGVSGEGSTERQPLYFPRLQAQVRGRYRDGTANRVPPARNRARAPRVQRMQRRRAARSTGKPRARTATTRRMMGNTTTSIVARREKSRMLGPAMLSRRPP